VHLRRALLLFAIVLGLAALATSVSRPSRESPERERSAGPVTREASPQEPGTDGDLRLPTRAKRPLLIRTGEAVSVQVPVPEPGLVELPGLGLSSPAERPTPARFDLLINDPGIYRVRFTPAGAGASRYLGRIVAR
jgi:hypothetical protein